MAAELGVSKTPIREALMRLQSEGLVVVQPQRGTFVFRIDAADARKLSEFRDVLEISALRMAMRRAAPALGRALKVIAVDMSRALATDDATKYRELDALYHECIIQQCANDYLASSYTLIALRVQALRCRLSSDRALNAASLKHHRALADHVSRGLRAKAVALLRQHIAKTADDFANTLGSRNSTRSPRNAAARGA